MLSGITPKRAPRPALALTGQVRHVGLANGVHGAGAHAEDAALAALRLHGRHGALNPKPGSAGDCCPAQVNAGKARGTRSQGGGQESRGAVLQAAFTPCAGSVLGSPARGCLWPPRPRPGREVVPPRRACGGCHSEQTPAQTCTGGSAWHSANLRHSSIAPRHLPAAGKRSFEPLKPRQLVSASRLPACPPAAVAARACRRLLIAACFGGSLLTHTSGRHNGRGTMKTTHCTKGGQGSSEE